MAYFLTYMCSLLMIWIMGAFLVYLLQLGKYFGSLVFSFLTVIWVASFIQFTPILMPKADNKARIVVRETDAKDYIESDVKSEDLIGKSHESNENRKAEFSKLPALK